LHISGIISILTGILMICLLVLAIVFVIGCIALVGWLISKVGQEKDVTSFEENKFGLLQYHPNTKYERQLSFKTRGVEQKKGGLFRKKTKELDEKPLAERPIAVVSFDGDVRATKRKIVSALIDELIVNKDKLSEAVVVVNSPGGSVAEYGLLYAEMERIRAAGISLTVCIDTYAASGGYLMSLPANRIVAAPFAFVGSVGVVAYSPNIHRLLKKHDIEPRLFTAGEFKRTVTLIGDDDEEAKQHFQHQLESLHGLFLAAVKKYRTGANFEKIGTGDHWTAEESQTQNLGLVDHIATSREYLLKLNADRDLVHLSQKKHMLEGGLGRFAAQLSEELVDRILTRVTIF
jgi:serine protease SohB